MSSNKYRNGASGFRIVDYDLHGIVGIRLVNPSPSDVKAVDAQVGVIRKKLSREPDITIHFTQTISTPSIKYIGLNYAGFTEEGFYVLRSSKAVAKVLIPFDKIGNRCEIFCESGLRSVPLLIAIINLTLIGKNYLPLHASAFVYNRTGILVTGWSKGGKTEMLLSFANHGAKYVGDEWIILNSDGKRMFGIPEPIRLWDWQFKYIQNIYSKIPRQKKVIFKSIHILDSVNQKFGQGRLKQFLPFRVLKEALPAFKRQLNVQIPPEEIFSNGFYDGNASLDKIFFLMSHNSPNIEVNEISSSLVAQRMFSSNQFEQIPFFEYYKAYKFAFPSRSNEFLENLNEIQKVLLNRVLKNKHAYQVLHPYPVNFEELFVKVEPYCAKIMENNGRSQDL